MTRSFTVHPENPQPRIIGQVVQELQKGALIVYPTDSSYAFACTINNKSALETIRRIRKLQPNHPMTLMCHDISQVAKYAFVDDQAFFYLKNQTPGPYTFVLKATKLVPKLVVGTKRKIVGVRIPSHPVPLEIMMQMDEPLMSSTLWLPDDDRPVNSPHEIPKSVKSYVNLVIDAGCSSPEPTTVVDLTDESPNILRSGAGDVAPFQV